MIVNLPYRMSEIEFISVEILFKLKFHNGFDLTRYELVKLVDFTTCYIEGGAIWIENDTTGMFKVSPDAILSINTKQIKRKRENELFKIKDLCLSGPNF